MKDSYCANYLWGSTLGIIEDKYIIITKNPPGADVNSSKMVPSGLTYVDCGKDAISASRKEIKEMGNYSHDFISFSNSSDILMALGEYIEKNDRSISLQLKVTFRILEEFCRENIDVWSKLIKD